MPKLKEGMKAPELGIPDASGKVFKLVDFKGKRAILYFYPKDGTPGCTVEACGFRDGFDAIKKTGAVIIGVSPDSPASHARFVEKQHLPFLLLSDENKEVCKRYGVWAKKKLYGREFMGVLRQTFIIGKTGKIEKIYEKVSPKAHTAEVLSFLNEK